MLSGVGGASGASGLGGLFSISGGANAAGAGQGQGINELLKMLGQSSGEQKDDMSEAMGIFK